MENIIWIKITHIQISTVFYTYIKMLTTVSKANISTLSKVLLFPIFTWYLKYFTIVFQFSDKFVYKPEGAFLV